MRYICGVDLAKERDYSALAVIADIEADPPHYQLVHLDQQRLGTEYLEVVQWIEATLTTPPLSRSIPLVLDVGGPGASVLELVRARGLAAVPVRLVGGERETRDHAGVWNVAKGALVSVLDIALGADQLRIATGLPFADALRGQLRAFTRKLTDAGTARFEARTEAAHDDLVIAAALALWHAKRHAGVPVFPEFRRALHVAKAPLEAMPGLGMPIARGWHFGPPGACVWLQRWDGDREIQVLFEEPPSDGVDASTFRELVVSESQVLFPGFRFTDYAPPDAFEPMSGSGGRRALVDGLRPQIVPVRGEGALPRQLEVMRGWLGRIVDGRVAFQIDPRCDALIRALDGGYVFRQVQGRVLPIPREDQHAAIVDALLVALAAPAMTLTAAERARIRGPKVLVPE
jgi:hypothetical protein